LQISAANLLVAGQQSARIAPAAPAKTTAAPVASNPATPEFAPLEFARAPQTSSDARPAPAAAQTYSRPGARLDIRV
jgi:hypothetical protein